MMIRLFSRVCLDYAWYATRLQYETNTLFSSCLTLFFFCFLDLFFVGTAQRKCFCTKMQMSVNWGYTIFWGESDIQHLRVDEIGFVAC
jgi:hypothetical protein